MKVFKSLCALALVMGLTTLASAETQNVRVSGDLAFRSISHWDYDLQKQDTSLPLGTGTGSSNFFDDNHYFLMTTEIQVDADLTDNVSTVVRLANETYWGERPDTGSATDSYDVNVLLANATFKEMLYSPLTVIVGRQHLWYGKGFIVGDSANYDPDGHLTAGTHAVAAKDDFSPFVTFDAIRAILDYDPWTIDLAYAKVDENVIDKNDDIDLYIANIGYVFDSYQGEAEAYYVAKYDRSGTNVTLDRVNDVHTIGLRGSFDPLENLTLAGEIAGQFGNYVTATQTVNRNREAWALDLSGEYRMPDVRWTPVLGLEYIFYSGNEVGNDDGDFNGWDPVYRGKWDTKIRDYIGTGNYVTSQFNGSVSGATLNADAANSNQHQILVRGSIQPTDDVSVEALYGHFWLDEEISTTFDDDHVGDEIDVTVSYDYTEDVNFSVIAAWFFPGDLYVEPRDDTAAALVGELTVSF